MRDPSSLLAPAAFRYLYVALAQLNCPYNDTFAAKAVKENLIEPSRLLRHFFLVEEIERSSYWLRKREIGAEHKAFGHNILYKISTMTNGSQKVG
jgi:hypothetical protein